MLKQYAHRLSEIQPFKVMKLLTRANELQAEGRPIIHMEVGEPDFPTPAPILASGKLALEKGLTKYTPAEGLPALRELLSKPSGSVWCCRSTTKNIFDQWWFWCFAACHRFDSKSG